MPIDLTPILLHSDDVPSDAKRALIAASQAPISQRSTHLEQAARSLVRQTDLSCGEVRDLIGLPAGACS
jgi:hypothetical protein